MCATTWCAAPSTWYVASPCDITGQPRWLGASGGADSWGEQSEDPQKGLPDWLPNGRGGPWEPKAKAPPGSVQPRASMNLANSCPSGWCRRSIVQSQQVRNQETQEGFYIRTYGLPVARDEEWRIENSGGHAPRYGMQWISGGGSYGPWLR